MNGRLKQRELVILSTLVFGVSAVTSHASTITVTNTNDNGPGSLRQALVTAHNGDTITFAVAGTITLTSGWLPISKNVTVSGPGADQLSIDGNQAIFVVGVFPGKTAAISGLSINNGQTGIWNEQGTLTMSDCVISGNSPYEGLYNHYGALTVSGCVVTGNFGGISSRYGELTVTHYEISGNSFGIHNDHGESSVTNCIVSSNQYGGLFTNGTSEAQMTTFLGRFLNNCRQHYQR